MGKTLGKIGIVVWGLIFIISLASIATYSYNEDTANKELGVPKLSEDASSTAIGLSFMFITIPSLVFCLLSYRHYKKAVQRLNSPKPISGYSDKYCPHCGSSIIDQSRFCGQCGKEIIS